MAPSNADVVRAIETAWDENRLDDLDRYFAPGFDNAQSATRGLPAGLAGSKMAHQGVMQSFPDRKVEILDVVEGGDRVFVRNRHGHESGWVPGVRRAGQRESVRHRGLGRLPARERAGRRTLGDERRADAPHAARRDPRPRRLTDRLESRGPWHGAARESLVCGPWTTWYRPISFPPSRCEMRAGSCWPVARMSTHRTSGGR